MPQDCPVWTVNGECRANADFVIPACPASCQACNMYLLPTPLATLQ